MRRHLTRLIFLAFAEVLLKYPGNYFSSRILYQIAWAQIKK